MGEERDAASVDSVEPGMGMKVQRAPTSPPAKPFEPESATSPKAEPRVLVVDDEQSLLRLCARVLEGSGYAVETASDGLSAVGLLETRVFDVILSDISMPGMDGLQLLRRVREIDLDTPVILMTGAPTVETAAQALEYGALRYLVKPIDSTSLVKAMGDAVRFHRLAQMKRDALELLGEQGKRVGDRAGLQASFGRALDSLWMAYQPIVSQSQSTVYGYEALVRTMEPTLPHPGALFSAAERLSELDVLGRAIRDHVARDMATTDPETLVFVNLHTRDLMDDMLYRSDAPLSRVASRVVLEVTERASLDLVSDVRSRINALKALGFKIAVDDLGAGYAGLTSFALLEPDIVKLDMSLVRNIHAEPMKRKLIRSIVSLSKELGMLVIAEGIETGEERAAIVELGCDLLQGFLFARPSRPFPRVVW
jgi:EAL domain-containing protein (putative c-di-GMP-specific phosphodiesterase class I)